MPCENTALSFRAVCKGDGRQGFTWDPMGTRWQKRRQLAYQVFTTPLGIIKSETMKCAEVRILDLLKMGVEFKTLKG